MIKNTGELTDLHKDLVIHLTNGKEASIYELERELERNRRHISDKCSDLNHAGVLHHREDQFGKKYYKLIKDTVKVSYSSDRYVGILTYLLFCFLISVVIGVALDPFFILGSAFLGISMFLKFLYSLLTEKESKSVRIRGYDGGDTPG